jgi:hypothetical protein
MFQVMLAILMKLTLIQMNKRLPKLQKAIMDITSQDATEDTLIIIEDTIMVGDPILTMAEDLILVVLKDPIPLKHLLLRILMNSKTVISMAIRIIIVGDLTHIITEDTLITIEDHTHVALKDLKTLKDLLSMMLEISAMSLIPVSLKSPEMVLKMKAMVSDPIITEDLRIEDHIHVTLKNLKTLKGLLLRILLMLVMLQLRNLAMLSIIGDLTHIIIGDPTHIITEDLIITGDLIPTEDHTHVMLLHLNLK